jgi:maltooligosyltrehalose trehalohydrolase
MGQEWAASTPFLYFTDHNPELGRLVDEGRRKDMQRYSVFADVLRTQDIPPPQSPETFAKSRLQWADLEKTGHAACLRLYQEALRLRRDHTAFRPSDRSQTKVT